MEVDELKGLLCDIINKVVDPLKLPMNFTADNINVFLLKDGNGIDELQKALAKEYLSMFSTVESVKIPGECLKNKNFKLCRYDFALSGSTIVVEIKSSYKFKMVGEDDNQEEDIVESIFNHSRNKNTGMSMESTGSSSSSYKTYNFPEHSTLSLNGTVGLRNIGNTCYMNAALQCLSHTTELSNYFLDRKYKKDINLKNPLGSQGKVAENYAGLIFELWNGVKSIASPSFLRGEIARQNNNFDNFNQHDSQELLSFLLDALHEDLNLIEKKPYTDKVESHDANVDRLVLSRQSWVNHLKRNFSFIYKLFFAQFQSEVICKECKTISLTYEPYQIISLGIPGTTTFYADFFYIPPNHSVKASKFSIEVVCQSGYSGDVANTMGDLYKELPEDLLKVPKDRVQMFFVGFSVRGDSISPNTKISKVMEKVNEHSYRPNLFLFALTEEEAKIRDSPNSFIVMGLVCREEKNPSFNKVMFMYENSTLVQLYFECFKKFAHFYKSEYGEQGIEDTVKSNVDYQRSFLLNFMDIPVEERDFVISYNDKPYPLTVENQLTPLSEIFDSNSFIGDPRHVWINIVFRPNSNERIYFDSTKQCIIEKEAITVKFSSDLPEKIDIQYLLKKFSEPEDIDDDNLFHCSTCKKHTQITKTMHIYNVPRYLILHMKKLKLGLSRRSKPILDIKFPLEGMDITDCVTSHSTIDSLKINREEFGTDNMDKLQQFVDPFENRSEPDRLIYDCYAVINHTGSNYSGHYTAYAKTGDKWNYYDDDRIYPVYNPEYEVVTERAYVLFYKLREKEDQHPQQESTINKQ
jgi:ubiquitin C-terminal hydrolase